MAATQPPRGPEGAGIVSVSVRVPYDLFELLQDVALAHVITGVSDGARRGKAGKALEQPSVAGVIESLIEKQREYLEQEAEVVRGRNQP